MITASWGEIILATAGMLGILANGRLLLLMRRKRAAALRNGAKLDGTSILAANRYIRGEVARIWVCAVGAGYGIVGAALPDLLPSSHWFIVAAPWVLNVAVIASFIASLFDLRDDGRLTRMLQAEEI